MHEPLAPLTRPDPSPASPSLSAGEVRRRGDRLRLRRRAASALGAAAAVTAVAVAAALLTGGPGGTTAPSPVDTPSRTAEPSPSPTDPATVHPSPAPGFLGAIPAWFPLDLGFPEPGGDNDVRRTHNNAAWSLSPCVSRYTAPDELKLDEKGVSQAEPTRIWVRQLVLLPDDRTASTAIGELMMALENCRSIEHPDGSSQFFTPVDPPLRVGDESLSVVSQTLMDGRPTTFASLYGVVRVGNAVLVTALHGEFGAAMPEDLEAIVAEELEPTVRLAREMCVFAGDDAGRRSPCDS